MEWIEHPALKWFLPLPALALIAWPLVRFFKPSWLALEAEALELRRAQPAGTLEWRPIAAAVMGTIVLVLQYYYCTPRYFHDHVLPAVGGGGAGGARWGELLWQCWWGITRTGGYLAPVLLWKLLFRGDRIRDHGLRARGFREHLWVYALCVAIMVPVLTLAQRQPDFGTYYPFYSLAGRSWVDFLAWEAIYLSQFFALELFFRGWWIGASRSLGPASIFLVAVPYVAIHWGKPYFEAMGAMVAGVVLGSLAVRTRSIWAGLSVHATIALLMDVASLRARRELPVLLSPGSASRFEFPLWGALPWIAWILAVGLLLWEVDRWMKRRRRAAEVAAPASRGRRSA